MTQTTKNRVETRLQDMIRAGLELSRKAQAAHERAAQVQLQHATGQDGVTLDDVRAAQDAYRQATADELTHADSVALLDGALKQLGKQEQERELLTALDGCRTALDRLEGGGLRPIEVAERGLHAAHQDWRDTARQAQAVRARGRVLAQRLAQLRGQPSGADRPLTPAEQERFAAALEQWRLNEDQAVDAPNPLSPVPSERSISESAHAARWASRQSALALGADDEE